MVLTLAPGINEVDEKVWDACHADGGLDKHLQILMDKKLLEVLDAPKPKMTKEPEKSEEVSKEVDEKDPVAEKVKKKRGRKAS